MDDRIIDQQKTITFNTSQGKRRPDKINIRGKRFSINVPRKIAIKPAETATVNKNIGVAIPDGIVATLAVLPTIRTLGLKLQNKHTTQRTHQTLSFTLLIQSFTRTFTFKRDHLIGSLIFLNKRRNKSFDVENKTVKKSPRKRQQNVSYMLENIVVVIIISCKIYFL